MSQALLCVAWLYTYSWAGYLTIDVWCDLQQTLCKKGCSHNAYSSVSLSLQAKAVALHAEVTNQALPTRSLFAASSPSPPSLVKPAGRASPRLHLFRRRPYMCLGYEKRHGLDCWDTAPRGGHSSRYFPPGDVLQYTGTVEEYFRKQPTSLEPGKQMAQAEGGSTFRLRLLSVTTQTHVSPISERLFTKWKPIIRVSVFRKPKLAVPIRGTPETRETPD